MGMHFSNKEELKRRPMKDACKASDMTASGYKMGTPDLYPSPKPVGH